MFFILFPAFVVSQPFSWQLHKTGTLISRSALVPCQLPGLSEVSCPLAAQRAKSTHQALSCCALLTYWVPPVGLCETLAVPLTPVTPLSVRCSACKLSKQLSVSTSGTCLSPRKRSFPDYGSTEFKNDLNLTHHCPLSLSSQRKAEEKASQARECESPPISRIPWEGSAGWEL